MANKPLLSICIPTYNRAFFLKKTLHSIVHESVFMDTNDIEVVISDNCSTDKTQEIVEQFIEKFGNKIKYFKNEKNLIDENQELCLQRGNGEFLKMQNDTLMFKKGSLQKMLNIVKNNIEKKPNIYFLNLSNQSSPEGVECYCSDAFVKTISYHTTWIGGFGVWKSDLITIKNFSSKSDLKLPQTDVLFRMLQSKAGGYVCNLKLFESMLVPNKGGYNIAEVFGKNYLSILKEAVSDKIISNNTYKQEKKNILDFINNHYFDLYERYNFQKTGYYEFMKEDYKAELYFWWALLKVFYKKKKIEYKKKRLGKKYKARYWRKINQHNEINIKNMDELQLADMKKIIVGKKSYGVINLSFFGAPNESLIIGNYVSIGANVKFILGGNHPYKGFSTFPFKVKCLGEETEARSKGPVIIEDDVWIGDGVTVLSGVTIGQGAVIAAGSIVTKDVEPYAIVAGNPAKLVKYRFDKEIIEKLIKVNFAELTDESILKNVNLLYEELTIKNVDEVIERFLG